MTPEEIIKEIHRMAEDAIGWDDAEDWYDALVRIEKLSREMK